MKVTIRVGNIISHKADIIVNSANKTLMRGSGLCEAIHQAAGIQLQRECQQLKKELQPGQVISTKAYNLPHNHVIHTLGPKKGGEKISLVYDCYDNTLKEAEKLKARSISFPAIGTGSYNMPLEISASIVKSVLNNMAQPKYLTEINLFFLKEEDANIYRAVFK